MTQVSSATNILTTLNRSIEKAQKEVSATLPAISDTSKAGTYAELGLEEAVPLLTFEAALTKTDQFVENIKAADRHLTQMDHALSSIQSLASQFKRELVLANSGATSSDVKISTQSASLLDQVVSHLNAEVDGVFLFGGSRSDTRPVDKALIPAVTTASGPDTTYYQGNHAAPSIHTDRDTYQEYGVFADNDSFEFFLRSLKLAATADGDQEKVAKCLEWMDQALAGLPNINKDVNNIQASLEQTMQKHEDFKALTEVNINDIKERDTVKTITDATLAQTKLELSLLTMRKYYEELNRYIDSYK